MANPLSQQTFLVYDYETFGKNPATEWPAQFAGIRTDSAFKVLGKPEVFFCQPPNDYLPDPEAVLMTGITPQKALRNGIKEAEFARRIHQLFSTPDTCILGYNNICFDDEVSRNLFYRNFCDPYSWSWQQGNSRWDLINVIRACYALRPEGIKWPHNNNGLPNFQLERLTKANNITHDNSHNAIADAYATLALAKLIRQAQPKLFNYFYHYRSKKQLKSLINITTIKPLVYVSGIFGVTRSNITCIAPLAWHPINANTLIVCDLSCNIKALKDLNTDILHNSFHKQQDILLNNTSIPLKLVNLNKCPALAPANTLRPLDAERLGISHQLCLENLVWLRMHPELQKNLVTIFTKEKPFTPNNNVDTQLYNGFFNNADRATIKIILSTAPEKLSKLDISFIDSRLKPLLFRYRARNFPHSLDNNEQSLWLKHRRDQFTQSKIATYIQKLNILSSSHKGDEYKTKLLSALFEYLKILIT